MKSRAHQPLRLIALATLTLASVLNGVGSAKAQEDERGSLVVQAFDEHEQSLPGACFDILTTEDETVSHANCDAYDGNNDGTTTISDLPSGTFVLSEIFVPRGYVFAKDRKVTIAANDVVSATVRHKAGGQSLVVTASDDRGAPLPGLCFSLYVDLGDGNVLGGVKGGGCDFFDGANDGTTTLSGLEAGRYLIVESFGPEGYAIALGQSIAVAERHDAALALSVQKGGETLAVKTVDPRKHPVVDACWRLYEKSDGGARGALYTVSCDVWDGSNDGTVNFVGLLPGAYVLVAPAALPGFRQAKDRTVTISEGKAKKVTVTLSAAPTGTPTASPSATSAG